MLLEYRVDDTGWLNIQSPRTGKWVTIRKEKVEFTKVLLLNESGLMRFDNKQDLLQLVAEAKHDPGVPEWLACRERPFNRVAEVAKFVKMKC